MRWIDIYTVTMTLSAMPGKYLRDNDTPSKRLRRWILRWADWVADKFHHHTTLLFPRLGCDARVVAPVAEAVASAHSATVTVGSAINPGQPLLLQVQILADLFVAISNDLQTLRQRVDNSDRVLRTGLTPQPAAPLRQR
ncbi:hypothetical protein V7968_32635 [Nocardia vulneris]|uniref:hypothetical protein n=1 Tax=Nocardia vulneris TaxID=1141657 RepID=UPI0030D531F2